MRNQNTEQKRNLNMDDIFEMLRDDDECQNVLELLYGSEDDTVEEKRVGWPVAGRVVNID